MGGHSHWSQIKRQKGGNDAKRGQLFTRLSREISVAAREGGQDATMNPRLRLAIDKAKESNMPADTIKRAIERGGPADASSLQEITFEGYGPSGVAILIQTVTDNRNRTVSEMRTTLSRNGGNLGEAGTVAWQFEQKGLINIQPDGKDPDELALIAIDAGADDVRVEGEYVALRLLDVIEELDDVQKVYSNADFPESVLMEYAAG
jgi:YebC/PmpR family DNA-binding regulatory protein